MSAEGRPDEELAPAGEAGASGAGQAPHDDGPGAAAETNAEAVAPNCGAAGLDHPDSADDALADARAFADSVLAGLEQAGLLGGAQSERSELRFAARMANPAEPDGDIAAEDLTDGSGGLSDIGDVSAPEALAVEEPEHGGAYEAAASGVSGENWEADVEIEGQLYTAEVVPFSSEAHFPPQDASGLLAERDDEPEDAGEESELYDQPFAAQKHDALADAVQAALLAVYGGQGYGAQTATAAETPLSTASPAAEPEESLPSPEDVILNYFQYTSQAHAEPDIESAPQPEPYAPYRNGGTGSAPAHNAPQPALSSYASAAARFDGQAMPNMGYASQSAASAPPPLPFANLPVPTPVAETDIRANSKLLGAAGLGLIGGIAFAAVMAVFLINSMEPEEQPQLAVARQPALAPQAPAAPPRPEVVAANVAGGPGATVPLQIEVRSLPRNEQTLVSITGIPAGGRLNSGVDAGSGNWLLPPRRLNGLTLSLPADFSGPAEIGVEILDSNVRVPLSEKRTFTVALTNTAGVAQATATPNPAPVQPGAGAAPAPQNAPARAALAPEPAAPAPQDAPASAAALVGQQLAALSGSPAAVPAPASPSAAAPALPQSAALAPMPPADVQDLIREGNRHMRDGDILRAREYYEQAVRSGNAEAALAMGRSFDPSYFDRLDLKTGEPDPAKAFEWYREAMNAGLDRAAQVRIENLRRFLNR